MSPSPAHDGYDRTYWTRSTAAEHRPAGGGADQPEQPDTPEEEILAALLDNGGRLDQRDVPEAAGLSQSTVSRKLIAMEDSGEVNRYEIGRRKVVFVPGEEPDAFDSPLHGEETPHETPS